MCNGSMNLSLLSFNLLCTNKQPTCDDMWCTTNHIMSQVICENLCPLICLPTITYNYLHKIYETPLACIHMISKNLEVSF